MADNLPEGAWSKRYADCKNATESVRKALLTLRTMVRTRETDTEDIMLQVEAYRRKLCMYPPPEVLTVLERWPDEHEFWPTWHELKADMDQRMAARKAMETPRLEHKPAPTRPPSKHEIETELRRLRDPDQQFLCRRALIALGETMLARMA